MIFKPVKIRIICAIIISLVLSTSYSCSTKIASKQKIINYDLTKPDNIVLLPGILHEISGITNIDSETFACVQDEDGIVFFYNVDKNEITRSIDFHDEGDYEDICKVNSSLYILRSDGVLFEISNFEWESFQISKHKTDIPAINNEGLCYDLENNRLLIACKSKIGKGKEFKDLRAIYAFDLDTKLLSDKPVFEFNINDIEAFAEKHNIELAEKTKKNGDKKKSSIKFRPSAICINPVTKNLFLLSAVDHLLFVFNMNGKIENMVQLNPQIFSQAEGITFLENGDMFITNEGQDGSPNLIRFNYTK